MTTGQKWTDEEQRVICEVYAAMHQLELNGIKFNKAAIRRGTLPKLEGRSAGSYEMKMCNISAAIRAIAPTMFPNAYYIKGYKPLPGFQRSLKEEITRQLIAIDRKPGYAGHIVEEATKAGALKK